MPPVMLTLAPLARPNEREDNELFDPATYEPEIVADVDAMAAAHKCSCAASDDNPY